jgi:hypothetical protein
MATGIAGRREIMLKNVRFNYVFAHEPQTNRTTGKKTYGVQLILPADHLQLKEIAAFIPAIAAEKWGPEAANVLATLKVNNKICLKKGDTNKPGQPEYKGMYFIGCSHKGPFSVVETRGGVNVQLSKEDNRPRSGDYGNASIAIYAHTFAEGKGIFADVMGIQYVRKGEPLGGGSRVAAVTEFGVEPSDADSDAPAPAAAASTESVDDLLG